jgi:hypothetical protein
MPVVNGAANAREKVKFEYGQPVMVALKFAGKGKEVQGQFGAQFMFSTTDDRVFFVDHDIAYAIEQCPGAAEGQPIIITKTRGKGNASYWDIRGPASRSSARR